MPSKLGFQASRRSARVPLKVLIAIGDCAETGTCDGETIVVNLHGALIATAMGLSTGMSISVHVYITDKHAAARVVYVDPENPLHCGIELDEPGNIWGVSLPPNDWPEAMASERSEAKGGTFENEAKNEDRCPYCVVDGKFPPMTLLSTGRLICKKCGHIVFSNDTAFRCPCQKCLEINFSPRVRRLRSGRFGSKS